MPRTHCKCGYRLWYPGESCPWCAAHPPREADPARQMSRAAAYWMRVNARRARYGQPPIGPEELRHAQDTDS